MFGVDQVTAELAPGIFGVALSGVVIGILAASLPGLTAPLVVALAVSATLTLPPVVGIALVGAIAIGAQAGGQSSTSASAAGAVGGLVGAVALAMLAPPLAVIAGTLAPADEVWLALIAALLVAALVPGTLLKNAIGISFGLLLASVGIAGLDPALPSGAGRLSPAPDMGDFTAGLDLVSVMIGLYCLPVLMDLVADQPVGVGPRARPPGSDPGWGGGAARAGERAGSEQLAVSAGSLGVGLVPSLILGLPATPLGAMILTGLIAHGLAPGPSLVGGNSGVFTGLITALILASLLVLPVALVIGRTLLGHLRLVPVTLVAPAIAALALAGAIAARNRITDAVIMIALGAVGWLLARTGFSVTPVAFGLIMGTTTRAHIEAAWLSGAAAGDHAGVFFDRPVSLGLIAVIVLIVAAILVHRWRHRDGYPLPH